MKLREILTEEDAGKTPGGFIIPKASDTTAAGADEYTPAATTATGRTAAAGIGVAAGYAGVKGARAGLKQLSSKKSIAAAINSLPPGSTKDIEVLLKDYLKKNPNWLLSAKKAYTGKFSNVLRGVLAVLQIADSLIEFAAGRMAINDEEKAGIVDANIAQNARDYLLRKLVLEISSTIASATISIIAARTIALAIRAAIAASATAGTLGAGLIPSITWLVASEVAVQAFITWIKTTEGARAFANYFAGVLVDDDSLLQQGLTAIQRAIGMTVKTTTERPKVGEPARPGSAIPLSDLSAADKQNADRDASVQAAKKIGLQI